MSSKKKRLVALTYLELVGLLRKENCRAEIPLSRMNYSRKSYLEED